MTPIPPTFLKRTPLLLAVFGLIGFRFEASAQLGGTNLEGIRIEARLIRCFGEARDLDCAIILEFTGFRVTNAAEISPIRVIQAVDDTGRSLIRTNQPGARLAAPAPTRSINGCWQQVTGLRSPATNATKVRLLECETELMPRTTNTPIQTFKFKLENIRLPWIDPPTLQVVATDVTRLNTAMAPSACRLLLTFLGGPTTNCAGIKELHVHRIESDDGQPLQLKESGRLSLNRFSPLESEWGAGRWVKKLATFDAPSPDAKQIRVVEGEAELFLPNLANGAFVEFGNFIPHPGVPMHEAAFNRSKVNLTFLARDNFETRQAEWRQSRVTLITVTPQTRLPMDVKDSLLFSVVDPEQRIVKFDFMDEKGEALHEPTWMISTPTLRPRTNQLHLFTFKTPPPEGTRLKVTLITPESLRRIPFKVENIPLP